MARLVCPKLPLTDRIGILISKPAVLHFDEEIIDVELDNSDYHLKIKGKSLLIPYYSSNRGLGIYLGESDKKGERDLEVHIPGS